MSPLKLSGILLRELSLKTDKNGNDYYLGKLICDDGSQKAFFFFQPNYNLTIRLTDLEPNQEITLQGYWGRNSVAFIATNFYLIERNQENIFGMSEDNERFNFEK